MVSLGEKTQQPFAHVYAETASRNKTYTYMQASRMDLHVHVARQCMHADYCAVHCLPLSLLDLLSSSLGTLQQNEWCVLNRMHFCTRRRILVAVGRVWSDHCRPHGTTHPTMGRPPSSMHA